ncbi:hypothetical protein vseg_011443 [Gypsophila vaccaria]
MKGRKMLTGTSGKTVEVLGGQPTARNCRVDKVSSSRGTRGRRIRLSADVAIQFYDVQDRLGCQRASEAIDWLMEKAKDSIDELFDVAYQGREHPDQLGDLNDIVSGCLLPDKLSEAGGFEEPVSVYVPNLDSLADDLISLSEYNFMENSALFPYLHMENYMSNSSYEIEDSCLPSASSSNLKHIDTGELKDVSDSTQRR